MKNYIKLLLTHKRTLWFLITITFVLVLLVICIYSMTIDELISSIFLLLIFLVLISFILNNYFNFLGFFICQHKLFKKGISYTYGKCKVEMFQSSYKTTPWMKNNVVTIEIPPYNIECNFILTSDFFALFCKVTYFFSLFKREIPPILIKFDNNPINSLGLNKRRVVLFSNTYYERETLVISFTKKLKDIKKLKIVNFKNTVNQLHNEE